MYKTHNQKLKKKMKKRGSFGNTIEYGTLLSKEEDIILLIKYQAIRMISP